jgi:hypothetical protein
MYTKQTKKRIRNEAKSANISELFINMSGLLTALCRNISACMGLNVRQNRMHPSFAGAHNPNPPGDRAGLEGAKQRKVFQQSALWRGKGK